MENIVNQKKQLAVAVSAQLMEFMSSSAGIDERLLHKLVWQSSKKLAKKYFRIVKQLKKLERKEKIEIANAETNNNENAV